MATATAHILAKMRECSLLWLNFTRVENEIIEKTGAREDNCKFPMTIQSVWFYNYITSSSFVWGRNNITSKK